METSVCNISHSVFECPHNRINGQLEFLRWYSEKGCKKNKNKLFDRKVQIKLIQ